MPTNDTRSVPEDTMRYITPPNGSGLDATPPHRTSLEEIQRAKSVRQESKAFLSLEEAYSTLPNFAKHNFTVHNRNKIHDNIETKWRQGFSKPCRPVLNNRLLRSTTRYSTQPCVTTNQRNCCRAPPKWCSARTPLERTVRYTTVRDKTERYRSARHMTGN